MEWKAFKDELPEVGSLIAYGNHRFIETGLYYPDDDVIVCRRLNYKNVTHWCYIDLPPVIEWESEWK